MAGTPASPPAGGLVTRVALVDDDMFVRTSLARQLEATRQVTVCGVYAGGAEGVAGITADPPEVVLMDIAMPDLGGIEAIRLIRAAAPELPILALTSLADQDSMLDILDAGAVGFLSKDLPVPTMVSAIQAARHGMSVLAPDAARQVVKAPAPRPQPALTDLETTLNSCFGKEGYFTSCVEMNTRRLRAGRYLEQQLLGAVMPLVFRRDRGPRYALGLVRKLQERLSDAKTGEMARIAAEAGAAQAGGYAIEGAQIGRASCRERV